MRVILTNGNEIQCQGFVEANRGIALRDGNDDTSGYIPDNSLEVIVPEDSDYEQDDSDGNRGGTVNASNV